jgi:prepilin-type N-terminal cleavage/methylation domain-containing protein
VALAPGCQAGRDLKVRCSPKGPAFGREGGEGQKSDQSRPGTIASDEGFTLAELLVALAVTAIVLGLAAGGIGTAVRLSEASAAIDRATALAAARHTIGECIEAALALSEVDGKGHVRLAFTGSADRLELVCPLRGLTRAVIGLRPSGSRFDFILEEAPFTHRLGAAPSSAHLLAGDVAGLAIRYLGEERDGRGLVWRTSWSGSRGTPPLAVAIGLSFPEGDMRRWPELIVRVAASPG